MVLQLAVMALVLAITLVQSVWGVFSGIITAFCCVVSACLALGLFEWATDLSSGIITHPGYTAPACLLLIFFVSVIVLRTLADNFIRGNIRVPAYVDFAGGAICGFVTAQICMGVLVLSFLMLPFGGKAGMYQRYARDKDAGTPRATFKRSDLWLSPDGFTCGLVGMLSAGSLSNGTTTFASVYPDFPEWVFWSGNTVQAESLSAPARDKNGDGNKALSAVKWWEQKQPLEAAYRTNTPDRMAPEPIYKDEQYKPGAGMKLIGVRLAMDRASGDRGERDVDHRLRPTQIRLVGDSNGTPRQYVPSVLTGLDAHAKLGGKPRIVDLDSNFSVSASEKVTADAYFEVDSDFRPHFVEYRRFARSALSEANFSKTAPDATVASATPKEGEAGADAKPPANTASGRGTGLFRFVDSVDLNNSGDIDRLPVPLLAERVRSADTEVDGDALKSGRVFGDVDAFAGEGPKVERFRLPEGKRLCQIRYSPKKAMTTAGQVFNYVARTVNQYSAVDSNGGKHPLSGYFAIVKRGDREYVEVYYVGDSEVEGPAFRGLLDFKEIKPSELTARDDAVLGLLFLVPPGVTINGVENQRGQGPKDLNLKMQ